MSPNSPPRLSVLLPVRDAAPWLAASLASLARQTEPGYELIAVDDGSRDESGEILEAASRRDPRIVVRHTSARGLPAALNLALSLARAPWIARPDADDVSPPPRPPGAPQPAAPPPPRAVNGAARRRRPPPPRAVRPPARLARRSPRRGRARDAAPAFPRRGNRRRDAPLGRMAQRAARTRADAARTADRQSARTRNRHDPARDAPVGRRLARVGVGRGSRPLGPIVPGRSPLLHAQGNTLRLD